MPKLSYPGVVSSLALFVALGGTSYAITRLPRDSVGSAQVRNGSLRPVDLSPGARTAGPRGPRGAQGPPGPLGAAGGDLTGSFPSPAIRPGALSADEVSNPFVFRAVKVAAQDSVAGGIIAVSFGGEDFDPHDDFAPAASTFTAPITGYYQFSTSIAVYSGGATVRVFPQLNTVGRSNYLRGTDTTFAGYHQAVVSGLLQLNKGEKVSVTLYTSAVTNLGVEPSLTYFSGFLVAPS